MIDRDHLARQTGQDPALQQEILTLFLEQMHELDQLLEAGPSTGFYVAPGGLTVEQAFHRYRGSAIAVGATCLATGLARAEQRMATSAFAVAEVEALRSVLEASVLDARALIAALSLHGLAKKDEIH